MYSFRKIKQISSRNWFPVIFLPVAFLFLLYGSVSTSPLYVTEGFDSTVFKNMGVIILQGKTPYVDYFDHKGPILYFIQALGQWLYAGRIGIFMLQVLNLWGICVFLFKMAGLLVSRAKACLMLFPALAVYLLFICEGNHTQEWGLLPVSIVSFLALRFMTYQRHEPFSWQVAFIFGLCFGYVFYIQPNDAVAQIGGLLTGIGLYLLYHKRYNDVLRLVGGFSGAVVFVTLPLFCYFASRHALADWYYGMITHNKLYAGGVSNMLHVFLNTHHIAVCLLYIGLLVLAWRNGFSIWIWLFAPQCILAMFVLGERGSLHYYLIFIPVIVCLACFVFKNRYLMSLCLISLPLLVTGYLKCDAFRHFMLRLNCYWTETNQIALTYYAETDRLLDQVLEDERSDIWNYNLTMQVVDGALRNYISVFRHKGLMQTNKAIHYGLYQIDPNLKKRDNIQEKRPKWVVVNHHDIDLMMSEMSFHTADYAFIETNYTLVARTDTTICDIMLYRRNDMSEVHHQPNE